MLAAAAGASMSMGLSHEPSFIGGLAFDLPPAVLNGLAHDNKSLLLSSLEFIHQSGSFVQGSFAAGMLDSWS